MNRLLTTAEIDAKNARLIAQLSGETKDVPLRPGASEGDQLRGIPAIGRGVSGAVPGTNPEGAVR